MLGSGRKPRRFIVLELLDGGSLSHSLGLRPDSFERMNRVKFSYLETLSLSRDLASALDHLHEQWSDQVQVRQSLRFRVRFIYTVVVLFHVEWRIRQLWCSSTIIYYSTSIAYNHYTDINIYPIF